MTLKDLLAVIALGAMRVEAKHDIVKNDVTLTLHTNEDDIVECINENQLTLYLMLATNDVAMCQDASHKPYHEQEMLSSGEMHVTCKECAKGRRLPLPK